MMTSMQDGFLSFLFGGFILRALSSIFSGLFLHAIEEGVDIFLKGLLPTFANVMQLLDFWWRCDLLLLYIVAKRFLCEDHRFIL